MSQVQQCLHGMTPSIYIPRQYMPHCKYIRVRCRCSNKLLPYFAILRSGVHVMHHVMCTRTSLQFYNNVTRAWTTRRASGLVAVRGTPEANSAAEHIRARIRLARPHLKFPIPQSLAVTTTLTHSPVDARMTLLKHCKGVHAAMLFVYVTWFQVLLTKAHSPIFLRFTLVGYYYIYFLLTYR